MIPSRRKETPTAVISGASRGALRSRRYATRSMSTPVSPARIMLIGKMMSRARTRPPGLEPARWLMSKPKNRLKKPSCTPGIPARKIE